MSGVAGWLSRAARRIVLLDAALLMGGVLLTSFNMLLIGWSVFIVALLLAIVAFVAIAALYRNRMDGWSWTGLLVVEAGLILALPQAAAIWSSYATTPTHAEMLLLSQTYPVGLFADAVLWVGLAFYGLAARGARALPAGVGWVFLVAAVIGLLGDLLQAWPVSPLWWVPAMIFVSFGLVAAVSGADSSAVPERSDGTNRRTLPTT